MTSVPRGTVVIINIFKTVGYSRDRIGTMQDCNNLKNLFEKLHFVVKIYSDVTDNGLPVPEAERPTARVRNHYTNQLVNLRIIRQVETLPVNWRVNYYHRIVQADQSLS